ncbi:hypothetical protein KM043_007794 [Ampulex compressa]|nr:hypothetical protein KM043_007794 [Ampulex compressa]
MIILLNHATWTPLLQLYLDPIIRDNNYLNKVYKEHLVESIRSGKRTSNMHTLKEYHERPINLQIGKRDEINRLSIAKVDILQFSLCGQYLAIKHQLYPTTLWIWNISADYTDYLLLENDIVAIRWNPTRALLLIFCKKNYPGSTTLKNFVQRMV